MRLTALDGVGGGLQGDGAPVGLGDVHAEHHPHTRVLAADVRLSLAQLDVRVAQLQDPRAVDSVGEGSRSQGDVRADIADGMLNIR